MFARPPPVEEMEEIEWLKKRFTRLDKKYEDRPRGGL
jgi:hypothetical protein